jgi:hypothetical protein
MRSESENNKTDSMGDPEMAPHAPHVGAERSPRASERLIISVCKDLFFVARIRETARLANVPLKFARTPDELRSALNENPRLVLLDLTGGFDYDAIFSTLGERRPPVLAFTTHALARQTQGWHARCDRVVTKETLTAELPDLLTNGIAS